MKAVRALSGAILRVEAVALIALTAIVASLILLNVVTRTAGMALFWVDELAIYAMIWGVFIGASIQLRLGMAIAVDLVPMMLPEGLRRVLRSVVALLTLAFAVSLLWLSYIWFDPLGLAAAGFDIGAFAGSTFNFIYQEPTVTVGVPKFLIWLIMPIVALTMTVHGSANVVDLLTGQKPPKLSLLSA